MKSKIRNLRYVSLTGGLGNQLFQIAEALRDNYKLPLYLVEEFGKPRLNNNGDAEVFSFKLPFEVAKVNKKGASSLHRKLIGHTLKVSEHPTGWEQTKLYHDICVFTSSVFLSIYYKRIIIVVTKRPSRLGLSLRKKFTPFYLGYFQGVQNWDLKAIKKKLGLISVKSLRTELQEKISYARTHNLIFLHIRLTDYFNEPEIGLLSVNYFMNVFKEISSVDGEEEVWIFSDDHKLAKELVVLPFVKKIEFISEKQFSVSETFELMRYGSKYILSNSTFGWWAAFLSKKERVQVAAPAPWFRKFSYDSSIYISGWKKGKSEWWSGEVKSS